MFHVSSQSEQLV